MPKLNKKKNKPSLIRSKKLFKIGSVVSMAVMLVTLMLGFVGDGRHYSYVDFNFYRILFTSTIVYIVFSIVAVTLYNKHIMAINIINLILTSVVYVLAMVIVFVLISELVDMFVISLIFAVGVAIPFHLLVEIFALIAQGKKKAQAQPTCID